jgi:transcriptional regulator with XRE-family HTH domain
MNLEQVFGEELRKIREEKGLSQEQLGFESEYHRTYISQLERGQKSTSLKAVFRITKALGIKPSELISRVEKRAITTQTI